MRYSVKIFLGFLALSLTLAFGHSKECMGGGANTGSLGEPPKGLAIQSDAAGQKLVGDIFVEHYNYQVIAGFGPYAEVLRVLVKLRSGNIFGTFFMDLDCNELEPICIFNAQVDSRTICQQGCYDTYGITIIQQAVMAKLRSTPQFINFVNSTGVKGNKWNVTLTRFQEVGVTGATDPQDIPSLVILADLELAVK